jgi:hypothetical protein
MREFELPWMIEYTQQVEFDWYLVDNLTLARK